MIDVVKTAKDSLFNKISTFLPKEKIAKVEKAFLIAEKAHSFQKRASGEPYITHPLAVAEILADLKLDSTSIITAILHDTIEDTTITYKDIEDEFGTEVAKLVDGVTKLAKIEYQPENLKQAENFRKLLIAISEDIRVLLVKLADRVHNIRTLNCIKNKEKRIRIAHETMEIYAPLAERIGIHKFKNELQDSAFAELYPEVRESILSRLSFLKEKGGSIIETIVSQIKDLLKDEHIKAEVYGREKTPCSIWKKMEHKNVTFEQLSDIIAFRIIVDSIAECYHVLGIMHSHFHVIPDTFKDYISTPKTNGYKSLHTVVLGPETRCIEIQIRTQEMNDVAELGVAAHWIYKQGEDFHKEGNKLRWIKELLEILENTSSPEEFMENTKLEMYYDQVFCFTPKGELISLPYGSTPVDFAFAVHSKIGLSCIGAKINGRIVPLKAKLSNGDQVEIMRSKTPMPSPAWEKFVVTGKAKAGIRRFIRAKQKDEYIILGKAILAKTFEQNKLDFSEDKLSTVLEKFHKKTTQELLAAVGEGIIDRLDVFKEISATLNSKKRGSLNPLSLFRFKSSKEITEPVKTSIPIRGLIPGMAIHFAGCCHPLPGDRIVGIVNTGEGVTIHTLDCDVLDNFTNTPERWLDVTWETQNGETFFGRIKVVLSNEQGSLASLTSSIASMHVNISNFKIVGRSLDFFEVLVDVEVKDIEQLSALVAILKSLPCVHSVERTKA